VEMIYFAKNKDNLWALMNMVIILHGYVKSKEFLEYLGS
jgi:hypothetical protein